LVEEYLEKLLLTSNNYNKIIKRATLVALFFWISF